MECWRNGSRTSLLNSRVERLVKVQILDIPPSLLVRGDNDRYSKYVHLRGRCGGERTLQRVMELAYIPTSKVGFCGFDSRLADRMPH